MKTFATLSPEHQAAVRGLAVRRANALRDEAVNSAWQGASDAMRRGFHALAEALMRIPRTSWASAPKSRP